MIDSKLKEMILNMGKAMNSDISIVDLNGYVMSSSKQNLEGEYIKIPRKCFEKNNYCLTEGNTFYKIGKNQEDLIVVHKREVPKEVFLVAEVFMDKNFSGFDESEFFKNVLYGSLEEREIEAGCEKLKLDKNLDYQVIIIKTESDENALLEEIIKNMIYKSRHVKLDDGIEVVISNTEIDDELANSLYEVICSDLYTEPYISIGMNVTGIKNINTSYKNALFALKFGNHYTKNKRLYRYSDMIIPMMVSYADKEDIKKLINHNKMSLQEIMSDEELMLTASSFFENNLSISETARKLYIHRNTLTYRLSKIKKKSGYDLRKFEDALNFKTILFMYEYLSKDMSV